MKFSFLTIISVATILYSCGSDGTKQQSVKSDASIGDTNMVKLIIVDPGHFHAALLQKKMYEQISSDVHVYAPVGPDCQQHLKMIESYNGRSINPTSWNEIVYTGNDYFEKMLAEKAGNVVVLSGNNGKKAEYITKSIDAGLNVLADKPMIIVPEDFVKLQTAFKTAKEKGVLLYDIMTERYEIASILQKLLSHKTELFGTLITGSKEKPAVTKEGVHYFSKVVSGNQLIRPVWFFDFHQQGEGIVDITTHFVDQVQWQCFPEQILSPDDIKIITAKRWTTLISKDEFREVTGADNYPAYLQDAIKDGKLNVFSNGEMVYQIKGIYAKISIEWKYQTPPGEGDTYYSVMRGTNCDLVIKQGAKEKFLPTLYIENVKGIAKNEFIGKLMTTLRALPYDSLNIETVDNNALRITVPKKYRIGHEEHFALVVSKFLEYLKNGKLPEWEESGMITKYYTTTSALKVARISE